MKIIHTTDYDVLDFCYGGLIVLMSESGKAIAMIDNEAKTFEEVEGKEETTTLVWEFFKSFSHAHIDLYKMYELRREHFNVSLNSAIIRHVSREMLVEHVSVLTHTALHADSASKGIEQVSHQ